MACASLACISVAMMSPIKSFADIKDLFKFHVYRPLKEVCFVNFYNNWCGMYDMSWVSHILKETKCIKTCLLWRCASPQALIMSYYDVTSFFADLNCCRSGRPEGQLSYADWVASLIHLFQRWRRSSINDGWTHSSLPHCWLTCWSPGSMFNWTSTQPAITRLLSWLSMSSAWLVFKISLSL